MIMMILQREALEALKSIEVSGVTNMSAGIFTAIDQFNVPFAKRLVLARDERNVFGRFLIVHSHSESHSRSRFLPCFFHSRCRSRWLFTSRCQFYTTSSSSSHLSLSFIDIMKQIHKMGRYCYKNTQKSVL